MFKARLATNADITDIFTVSTNALKRDSWSLELYKKEFFDTTKHYFVAYNDANPTKILGFVGYAQIFDEAHIMNLAVEEKYRRKGIGTVLVEELLRDAKTRGVESVTLEVRANNEGAIALYQKIGFVSSGIRPDYYPDRTDAAILWLYF